MEQLNELALFSGAGGGILGGKLLGWRTVCAVEFNAYAASVLAQRQNDGFLSPFPIWDDVRTFDGRPWRGIVDVVSGGFPCQDISAAGKGAGITGERSGLWKEFVRIIREVGPRYVFVENSPILTSRGIDVVLGDLASMGFDAEWGVLSAAEVGAPHKRDRIWIVAYANSYNGKTRSKFNGGWKQQGNSITTKSCDDVADADKKRRQRRPRLLGKSGRDESAHGGIVTNSNSVRMERKRAKQQAARIDERYWRNWWAIEPDVC